MFIQKKNIHSNSLLAIVKGKPSPEKKIKTELITQLEHDRPTFTQSSQVGTSKTRQAEIM